MPLLEQVVAADGLLPELQALEHLQRRLGDAHGQVAGPQLRLPTAGSQAVIGAPHQTNIPPNTGTESPTCNPTSRADADTYA